MIIYKNRIYFKLWEKLSGFALIFYLLVFFPYKTRSYGEDIYPRYVATSFVCACLWLFFIVRFVIGCEYGINHPDKCRVNSIGEVIIAPFFTIGCNISYKRFNKSLIIGD